MKKIIPLLALALSCSPLAAQVDYNGNYPWSQTTSVAPDSAVPGWFYNLGITGMRVQLDPAAPRTLVVKHVFASTPAATAGIQVNDVITGVEGQPFTADHQDGYGQAVFGAQGPIGEFGIALDDAQGVDGLLGVTLTRGASTLNVTLNVGQVYGSFSPTFPSNCPKSDLILSQLLTYLRQTQTVQGSWSGVGGHENHIFAGLALLSDGSPASMTAAGNLATYYNNQTNVPIPANGLNNWKYLAAAIYLSEYYHKTNETWVLTKLNTLYSYLFASQYTNVSQIVPGAFGSDPTVYGFGGWGHNPGFEGYGPIAMTTGQGALALALMKRVGVNVDRTRLDAAYDFIVRGTGANSYVWYADGQGGGPNDWADPGRTGAAAIANWMSPYTDSAYATRAINHARFMGTHPQSFPDTHGSPTIGMAYAAMGSQFDPASFRQLLDNNRWWFSLAHTPEGNFYYQPNRDNAGYGTNPRFVASSVTALILSLPKRNLMISERVVPGELLVSTLDEETDIVNTGGTLISAANFGEAAVTVNGLLHGAGSAAGAGLTINSTFEGDFRNGASGLTPGSTMDRLLSGIAGSGNVQMTINGLTIGQEYLFQTYWEGVPGQTLTITMEGTDTLNAVADRVPALLISYRFVASDNALNVFIDRDDSLTGDLNNWLSGYSLQAVTPAPPDTTPPTPNPASFASSPAAASSTAISMNATTGTDASGPVEYLFTETSNNPGGTSSGWQTSPNYTDSGLTAATQYSYTVTLRDSLGNTGTASAPANATTQASSPLELMSLNFYAYGGFAPANYQTVTLEAGEFAGVGSYNVSGWQNFQVPFGLASPMAPFTLTSNLGATATMTLNDVRNGWTYAGAPHTNFAGGNGDLMNGHCNGTEDPYDGSAFFNMSVTNISYQVYDLIVYIGSNAAQFGNGTGKLILNGGAVRDFTLTSGEFNGFVEITNAVTPGNYVIFRGLRNPSLTLKVWGNGFNHIGPCGFQIVKDASGVIPPGPAANPNPADASVGHASGTDLSWTGGLDAVSRNVYFGTNPTPGASELRGNQTASTFDPGTLANGTYYWRIDEVNADGTTPGPVWSFKVGSPAKAFRPMPWDGMSAVALDAGILKWVAGASATASSNDVYFGTDASPDVSEFRGNQSGTTFNPGLLTAGTTYYWRVDQVNAQGTTSGDVWSFTTPSNSSNKVKIFIMAGQSNMEGHGEINPAGTPGTLQTIYNNDPVTYAHLKSGGNWAVRDDAWIWYKRGGTTLVKGGLTAGYGSSSTTIGPELQFGHAMGDYYGQKVLLIKTAWGGKSLRTDFRPPSSGWSRDVPVTDGDECYYYKQILDAVVDATANLQTYFPTHNPADGYEIAGFAWHQGWNDRVTPAFAAEYEVNMAKFIRDVRSSVGVPRLPFVIATAGMDGNPDYSQVELAQLQMENFTTYPDFNGNVAAIDTQSFWFSVAQSPADQGYHWNRNAGTYYQIGKSMAQEMQTLIETGGGGDIVPPTPNPMTWASPPSATGDSSITMTATSASDVSGVEYFFDETSGNPGGTDSGWQDSPVYTDTGLQSGTSYTYTVTARDKSPVQNTGTVSSSASTTTQGSQPLDIMSVNFFVGPDWPYGGLDPNNPSQIDNVKVATGMTAGMSGWSATGWLNYLVPWNPAQPQSPVTLSSGSGSTASFVLKDCRNGWTYSGGPRTTLIGDGNGNMMDAHVNSTLDGNYLFDMEVTNIPYTVYDVIFYLGASQAQFGDGTGVIKFNGGADRAFKLKPGAFDGTFTEMVDATTQGNYIVFTGVTGSSFTTQTWGTGPTGFNHVGPFGFQIRKASGFATWADANNAIGQSADQDHDTDGVPNGIEYFLGGNTTTTGFTTLPGVSNTNNALSITWIKSATYSGIYGIDYRVETSDTLTGIWIPETLGGNVTVSGNDVKYTYPAPLGTRKFTRLRVTGP